MTGRLSRRRLLALAAAGLGTLSGCGYRPGGGDIRWETASGHHGVDDLLVAPGTAFAVVRSEHGYDFDEERWADFANISAYSVGSGERRWKEKTAPVVEPAVAGQTLYVGTDQRDLVAFWGETGERWRVSVESFPRIVGAAADRVYVLSEAGAVAGFAADDGEQVWETTPGADAGSTLAAGRRGVVVQYADGTDATTVASFGRDGKRKWSRTLGSRFGGNRIRPTIDETAVYAATDGKLFALDADDGSVRWERTTDRLDESPVVADESLYYVSGRTLHAADVATGESQWRFKGRGDRRRLREGVASAPAVADGTVYAGTQTALYALDADDGSVRWRVESDETISEVRVTGQGVLVADGNTPRMHHRR